jgi:anti-sigma factor RsiW
MMTCGAARRLFTRDLDGRLVAAERDAVARHLADCAACRAARARWVSFRGVLRASGPSPVPAGLAARSWHAAVRAAAAPAPSVTAWFVTAARPAAFAGALAALLMSLLAAVAAPRQAAPETALQDPMELAMQIWTAEVGGDVP